MFFAALIAFPVLAGLVAGVTTDRTAVPWALAGTCVTLGILGAVAMGLDPDTEGRAGAIAFGVIAGVVAAGLVWAGYGVAKLGRRSSKQSRAA